MIHIHVETVFLSIEKRISVFVTLTFTANVKAIVKHLHYGHGFVKGTSSLRSQLLGKC